MANGLIPPLPEGLEIIEETPPPLPAGLTEVDESETIVDSFFLPSDEQEPGLKAPDLETPSTLKTEEPPAEPAKKLKLTTEDYWDHLFYGHKPTDFDYGDDSMSGSTVVTQGWEAPKQIAPEIKQEFPALEKFRQEALEELQNDATRIERPISPDAFSKAEGFIKNTILDLTREIPVPEQSQSFITQTPDAIFPGIEKERREQVEKRVESALKQAESPIFWGTVKAINKGTSGFFRTLDNAYETLADITGMEKGGEFGIIADYIDDFNEIAPDIPEEILGIPIGNAFSDALTIGTQLGLELMITPTLKYTRGAQLTGGALTGATPNFLNNLAKVGLGSAKAEKKLFTYTSPKFVTQMGVSNFVNTYGELTKNNPEQLNKVVESYKAMGVGAFEGAMFTMLGFSSLRGRAYIQRATEMGPLSWATGVGINSVGFGGFTAIEQLITRGEINWDDVRHSTLTGFALGVVGLPKEIFGRAFGNYAMASSLATKTAVESTRSPEKMRDQAFELRRKASVEENRDIAESLRSQADAIDNFTDIKVINKDVLNNPEGYVDAIELSNMSRGEKDFHIDKINKTILENDPLVQKATPISNEINRIQELIDGVAENTALDANIKLAQVAELKIRLGKKQVELAEVFTEKPPEPIKPKEEVEKRPEPEITPEEEAEAERIATAEQKLAEEGAVEELTPEELEAFETARTEPEFETKDGKYIITKTPTGIDVFNIKTQKSVKPGSAQGKVALEEYKQFVIPRLKKGKRAEGVEEIQDEAEANRLIAETSENPQEIAETFIRATQVRPEEMTIQDAISQTLAGTRITSEAFARAGDPNFITPAIRLNYLNKEGIKSFDSLVELIKETGEGQFDLLDPIEMEQTIVDFITENPGGSKQFEAAKAKDPLVQELQERFRELAGFELTPEFAKKLVEPTEFERLAPEEQIEFINRELEALEKPPIDAEIERFTNRTESEVRESEPAIASIESKGENAESLSEQELRDGITEADDFIRDGGKKPPKEPPVEEPGPEGEAEKDKIADNVSEMFSKQEADAITAEKKTPTLYQSFIKNWVDRSGNLKEAIRKASGDFRHKAIREQVLMAGAAGKTESEYAKGVADIYGDLLKGEIIMSKGNQRLLADYIQAKRTIEIDASFDKRGKKRPESPGKQHKEDLEIWIERIEKNDPSELKKYGLKEFDIKKIDEAAQKYFKIMQTKLKELREEGLLTQEQFDKLNEYKNYSMRQFIQHLDPIESFKTPDKVISIPNSGIKELKDGSEKSLVNNPQTLLAETIARVNGRIARNRANKAMAEFAEEFPNNGFVKIAKINPEFRKKMKALEEKKNQLSFEEFEKKKQKHIETQFEDTPNNWTEVDYLVDGKRQRMFMTQEMASEYITSPEMSQRLQRFIQLASGNAILKAMATGYNPEFAVTNFPRDIGHIYLTTNEYSPIIPKFTAQITKDMGVVAKDVALRKGRVLDYIEEGGSLNYLTSQGQLRLTGRHRNVTEVLNLLGDIAGYAGHTSELLTRMALRERTIINKVNEWKKENPDQEVPTDVMKEFQREGTFVARSYIDFAQGGKYAKALDTALPYFNASIQGTRGIAVSARRDKGKFWGKIAQLGGVATVITAWNLGDDERAKYYNEQVSDRDKARFFVFMTGLTYKDEKGQERMYWLGIPKDHGQQLITGVFEGMYQNAKNEYEGKEKDDAVFNQRRLMEAEQLMTVPDISMLPPTAKAYLAYKLNIDLFFQSEIWRGPEVSPELEKTIKTPAPFVKLGEISATLDPTKENAFTLSPERTKAALEEIFTSNNIYTDALGGLWENTIGPLDDENKKELDKSFLEGVLELPGARRLFKSTNPNIKVEDIKTYELEENDERQRANYDLDVQLSDIRAGRTTKETTYKWITKQGDQAERKRLRERMDLSLGKDKIPTWYITLKYAKPEARARAWHDQWEGASDEERKQMLRYARKLKGIIPENQDAIFNKKLRELRGKKP